jgi:hypothetical protein
MFHNSALFHIDMGEYNYTVLQLVRNSIIVNENVRNENLYGLQSIRFIPEGVAEASQLFLKDAYFLPKLFCYE